MKLTRLRLVGFKSFVEPTDFLIEPGLTGVVGPNGCGKSNLVEALRWVMGESSHKSLRASGMDDVIFSGSGNRPARNTAEVALLVDNSDRTAPAAFNDFDQLDVSRRIERESGSTYKVNNKEVRARDVQLLFADASTGRHVSGLRPYLAAAGHVVIMPLDGEGFAHEHAEAEDDQGRPVFALPGQTFGPELGLHARFPRPGLYRLWGQFRDATGRVRTTTFTVEAR